MNSVQPYRVKHTRWSTTFFYRPGDCACGIKFVVVRGYHASVEAAQAAITGSPLWRNVKFW